MLEMSLVDQEPQNLRTIKGRESASLRHHNMVVTTNIFIQKFYDMRSTLSGDPLYTFDPKFTRWTDFHLRTTMSTY